MDFPATGTHKITVTTTQGEQSMKTIISVSMLLAVVTMLAISIPVIAANTDSRIESSAKKSYVFKTYLQGDDIKIQSVDGVVTLTGTVIEESHKSLAQETVAGLPGVKSVDNLLEIKGETPAKNSDAWLTTKVKMTLLFHSSVSAGTTEVDVHDGIVTLNGTTANSAQSELTSEYARDVDGVKGVVNEMIVKKNSKKTRTEGRKIDDASITALVKMTLLYHRSTSAINTKVETNRGVVKLTGKVKNSGEISLATKYASDVKGVKSVSNRMTIE
jgi:osmotically-inducible protein OsmY